MKRESLNQADLSARARIVHFHRKPFDGTYSIEGLFDSIRVAMQQQGCRPAIRQLPYYSRGLISRFLNVRWARQNQGDVNHITGDVHFIAAGLDPQRLMLTIHDLEILDRLTGLKRWIVKTFWFTLPTRRARIITVISEATRRELLKRYPRLIDKVHVIPDVIDSIFVPSPAPFRSEKPTILHVGTKANKNLPRLIEAMTGQNVRLHILGNLAKEQSILLKQSQIEFANHSNLTKQELYEAYQQADLLSFTSTCEGFGMPIIEAQAIERPVVTSNLSSMPEVGGRGAAYCNPYDVASIRETILKVIRDESYRNEIVAHGRVNRQRFNQEQVAAKYIQLYECILSKPVEGPR